MKRPVAYYFVAIWSLLMLFMGASALAPTRSPEASDAGSGWSYFSLVILTIIIWQAVGLFRMRRLNHWVAVGVLVCWTAAMLIYVALRLIQGRGFPIQGIVLIPTAAALNILSAWYLMRRSFLDFAARFATERDKEKHSRMMQKISQKKVSDETRS